MTNKPDGGAAVPLMPPAGLDGLYAAGYPEPHPGLTLRQLYAGMAMQGFLAADLAHRPEWIAEAAVEQADALLKALEADHE